MVASGQTLDKYQILERVGQGGMAVVYRGFDTSLQREVAIKVLHDHLSERPEAKQRFAREAQAVAKLRHECILEIYACSNKQDPESYIVTEFIHGPTLAKFVSGYNIKHPEVAAMIVVEVCRGLIHAHKSGILHRDIKPENIMIQDDGTLKLTDFGIAQMLNHDRVTATGQLLGSPAYMSPENLEGKRLDARSDVFAVGVLLYELAVGKLPFIGQNPHQTIKRIAEGDYIDPIAANPCIRRSLARIIRRAMARDREQRYPDMASLCSDLMAFLGPAELDPPRQELTRFFATPATYEMALGERLVAKLVSYGKNNIQKDKAAGLDALSRVLTLQPKHEEASRIIESLAKNRGSKYIVIATLAMVATGAAFLIYRQNKADLQLAAASQDAQPYDATVALADFDAQPPAPIDGKPEVAVVIDKRPDAKRIARRIDARPKKKKKSRVTFTISPAGSTLRLNGGDPMRLSGISTTIELPYGTHSLVAENPCCETKPSSFVVDEPTESVKRTLGWKPAMLTVQCSDPDTSISVAGKSVRSGSMRPITISSVLGSRSVKVVFSSTRGTEERVIKLKHGENKKVQCKD